MKLKMSSFITLLMALAYPTHGLVLPYCAPDATIANKYEIKHSKKHQLSGTYSNMLFMKKSCSISYGKTRSGHIASLSFTVDDEHFHVETTKACDTYPNRETVSSFKYEEIFNYHSTHYVESKRVKTEGASDEEIHYKKFVAPSGTSRIPESLCEITITTYKDSQGNIVSFLMNRDCHRDHFADRIFCNLNSKD